ncbi:MAG: DUF979 domain-containing protein, partial [Spirochaetales bacterium]|nr:DUF979 domain-containing protein [Spirochaetales bacterium]
MMKGILTELLYVLIGFVMFAISLRTLREKDHPKRWTTALFWGVLGFIFIFSKLGVFWGNPEFKIPSVAIGYLVLALGALAAFNRIDAGNDKTAAEAEREQAAKKLGNKIFIPAVSIALLTFFFAILPITKPLGSLVALGLASFGALIIAIVITKSTPKESLYEGGRLLKLVGPLSLLPQLLGALGAVFTVAGVGEVISGFMGNIIPQGSPFAGVLFYCIGMALFTIIMGNAFAAFAVITAGIGIPFVIAQGGDPVVVGILGLTAGLTCFGYIALFITNELKYDQYHKDADRIYRVAHIVKYDDSGE